MPASLAAPASPARPASAGRPASRDTPVPQSSEYGCGGETGRPAAKRPGQNGPMSTLPATGVPVTSAATASPTAGEILKPVPENPVASTSPDRPGHSPSIGRPSGVMSYTPVIPRPVHASPNPGTRRPAAPTHPARP